MLRLNKILSHLHANTTSRDDQRAVVDIGGCKKYENEKLDTSDRYLTDWEKKMDALLIVLLNKGYGSTHSTRKEWEKLPASVYNSITYYEEWLFSIVSICLDNRLVSETELHHKLQEYLNHSNQSDRLMESSKPRFKKGDKIIIRDVSSYLLRAKNWRNFLGVNKLMHHRVPQYAQNKYGHIVQYLRNYSDPKLEAFGIDTSAMPDIPLYRVAVNVNGNEVICDVLQHWLVAQDLPSNEPHGHHHAHGHGHDHHHQTKQEIERNAMNREPTASPYEILSTILIDLLIAKEVINLTELRDQMARVDTMQHRNFGAQIALRCWRDPEWKEKLIANPKEVLMNEVDGNGKLVYDTGIGEPCDLEIVENTQKVHYLVCCTLCSCYPRNLMGIPPDWYKSKRYRSECVSNPRRLLQQEFNTVIPENMKLIVCDSNNEVRYMVLPHFPSQIPGWERMTDEKLLSLISRDLLIGTKRVVDVK